MAQSTGGSTRSARELEALTDEALVSVFKKQDNREALAQLYGRYYPRVAAWCLRFSGSPQEAEDLAQEVFARVQAKLDGFREESRFSTWLYTVTRSVVINRGIFERRRRMESLSEDQSAEPIDPTPDVEDNLASRRRASILRKALNRLDPIEGKVLYLHYVDGLTLRAITELLELTNRSGAKKYIVNGKRHLREHLAREGLLGG